MFTVVSDGGPYKLPLEVCAIYSQPTIIQMFNNSMMSLSLEAVLFQIAWAVVFTPVIYRHNLVRNFQ